MNNRIEFTLDNLVYNVFVNSSNDIEFVLPHKIPNYFDVKNVKDKTKIFNADEITIKVFISTLEGLTILPEIIITSQDKDTKVITHGSLTLVANSLLSVTFTTIDGGASWLVNSCASTAESAQEAIRIAEGAVKIAGEAAETAKKASDDATSASGVADTAKTTANTASETAEEAKTAADSAAIAANSAKSTAEDAKTAAATAVSTANTAQANTVINKQEIDKTNETVNDLTTKITSLEGSVDTLSETVQQNTENIDKKVDTDDVRLKGNFGTDNLLITEPNFTTGTNNSVGSKGYYIIGYTGVHGESGSYDVTCDNNEFTKLQNVIVNNPGLRVTIKNIMNADSYSIITDVSQVSATVARIEVNNIYTNSDKTPYSASVDYSNSGLIWDNYPELGFCIKQREAGNASYTHEACLMICGHGELGTFDWCWDAFASGSKNSAQGDFSTSLGYNNQSLGKYSIAGGNSNKSGYASATFGHNNDGSQGQVSFIAGQGNVVDGLGYYHAVFGSNNKVTGGSRKLVTGSYNNDKTTNVFEIGNGGNNIRHNVFEVDKGGYIASKETYIADQIFQDGTMVISSEMSKNYITDKSTQVYMRILGDPATGIEDTEGKTEFGPYIGVNASAISDIETNYWYVLVVDIENKIEGWNPLIRTFYRKDNSDKAGTFFARRESLSVGNYKFIFPIYVDEDHQIFGFYGEQNVRNIVIGDVKLFKFHPMTQDVQKQHSYNLISYYTPYTSINNKATTSYLNLNIGFENINTDEYGYVTIYNTDDYSWYIVPVNESTEQQNFKGLVVTSNGFTKTILNDIQKLNSTIGILDTGLQTIIDKQNEIIGD